MLPTLKTLVGLSLFVACLHARATTLQEFRAKSDKDQASLVSDYILKMRTDIATKDPELARAIWAYFSDKPDGKPIPLGFEDLLREELKVDALAKQGKADLSKIQIEGMIVYVVKQHFKA